MIRSVRMDVNTRCAQPLPLFSVSEFVCLVMIALSIAEYFPAAEAQKGWRHLGREIITS